MDISLVAKMKKYDEFISCYNEGDEKKVYKGKSLLFYSLSNNDTESRYLITDFLLNKGAEVNVINECGENLLHILLSRTKHNIKQTAELCKKFGLHRTVFWLITRMHGEKHHWKLRSKCRIEQVCWRG